MKRACFAGACVVVAVLGCDGGPTSGIPEEQEAVRPVQQAFGTPLQHKFADWAARRRALGLRAPSVSLEFRSQQGSSLRELQSKSYAPGEGYAYSATTVIHYDGPADAGLERWPDLTLGAEDARVLGVDPGVFADRYVERMEALDSGFWTRHELGFEPRTYTITEAGTAVYPDSAPSPAAAAGVAAASAQDELVLGLSVGGPSLSESWTFGFSGVQDLEFSVELDWGLGLRLPLAGVLESPDPMDEGSTYEGTSTVEGANWAEGDYTAAGLDAEEGDESYMHFSAQACIELSGIVNWDDCAGPDFRAATDFTTPLGSGATLPLPTISYPLVDFGIAGIDFDVTPSSGSDQITANWSVAGDAVGGGTLAYTSAASPVTLAPVTAVDGPGVAQYSVDAFRYYFTEFALAMDVTLWVDVEIPAFPDWEDDWSFNLASIDLGGLTGALDLSVGLHDGAFPTGLTLDVPIVNVAPTADVAVGGGTVVIINGVPTISGIAGDAFTFTGTSHDPGRDDLTLSWDWGDGPPAPDTQTLYPVPGPTGPNDAVEVVTHAFDQACLYQVTFRSVDDDGAASEDQVVVAITGEGGAARMEGYWQHQLSRRGEGNLLDASVVECYLALVGHVSTVFDEVRDASTLQAGFDVVNLRQNGGSELERLDRQLLVLWLNHASGAIGYGELVDTDKDGVADTPLHDVMAAAEAARLDPASTPRELQVYAAMLHHISAQYTGLGSS